MSIRPLFFSTLLLAGTIAPSSAQTQQEMNAEAVAAFTKADKELNEVYAKVLDVLDDEAKEKLKRSQRAWVLFRDSEADFRADAEARGGSMWPLVHEGIRASLTQERVKALKQYLIEDKEK
ncbi:lysozyme inhibitor LprI family protein [Haloferula sp. BvORR071]|uniref:lysozyme inhibitor LprI family protein n=1 Tax=Haloferula sp. BvORR071 TaxID=1396141 RepID=UPI00054F23EC|nr:lysozyme inhibitor LprI family protein [Haloferula sp. BvORR071]